MRTQDKLRIPAFTGGLWLKVATCGLALGWLSSGLCTACGVGTLGAGRAGPPGACAEEQPSSCLKQSCLVASQLCKLLLVRSAVVAATDLCAFGRVSILRTFHWCTRSRSCWGSVFERYPLQAVSINQGRVLHSCMHSEA